MRGETHLRVIGIRCTAFWVLSGYFLSQLGFCIPAASGLTMSFTTVGGGGQTGAAAETTAMVMSNGDSWSGGASGVQGATATNLLGANPVAANVALKFDLGSFVSSMNVAYGVGNWAVENIQLTFQYTLYANNPRFGGGAGDFDVFWVANDSWVQGSSNPVFAADSAGLLGWAGDQSLLVRQYYSWSTAAYAGTVDDLTSWTTDKSGDRQGLLTVDLGADSKLVEDITTSDGGAKVSLYLMAASDTIGMTVFTGGATVLPTLAFDVVMVPEPGTLGLLGLAGLGALGFRRRRRQGSGLGFTLVEMVSVLAVAGILTTFAAAALNGWIEKASSVKCLSHLRQWGAALQCYIQDSGGFLPRRGQGVQPTWVVNRPDDWFNSLTPYLEMPTYNELYLAGKAPKPGDQSVFVCPSAKVTNTYAHFITYGMNMYLSRWDQAERSRVVDLPNPSTLAFLADSPGGYASTVPSSRGFSVMARHGGYANVAFVDGHVGPFRGEYLGCGKSELSQSDVRWQTGSDGDVWKPVF